MSFVSSQRFGWVSLFETNDIPTAAVSLFLTQSDQSAHICLPCRECWTPCPGRAVLCWTLLIWPWGRLSCFFTPIMTNRRPYHSQCLPRVTLFLSTKYFSIRECSFSLSASAGGLSANTAPLAQRKIFWFPCLRECVSIQIVSREPWSSSLSGSRTRLKEEMADRVHHCCRHRSCARMTPRVQIAWATGPVPNRSSRGNLAQKKDPCCNSFSCMLFPPVKFWYVLFVLWELVCQFVSRPSLGVPCSVFSCCKSGCGVFILKFGMEKKLSLTSSTTIEYFVFGNKKHGEAILEW